MTDVNLIAEISLVWTRPAVRGYRNFCRRGILRPRPAIIIGSACAKWWQSWPTMIRQPPPCRGFSLRDHAAGV